MRLVLNAVDIERLVTKALLSEGLLQERGDYRVGRAVLGFTWAEDALQLEVDLYEPPKAETK